ncbi:unnamed protein product [Sphagnum tenellum]
MDHLANRNQKIYHEAKLAQFRKNRDQRVLSHVKYLQDLCAVRQCEGVLNSRIGGHPTVRADLKFKIAELNNQRAYYKDRLKEKARVYRDSVPSLEMEMFGEQTSAIAIARDIDIFVDYDSEMRIELPTVYFYEKDSIERQRIERALYAKVEVDKGPSAEELAQLEDGDIITDSPVLNARRAMLAADEERLAKNHAEQISARQAQGRMRIWLHMVHNARQTKVRMLHYALKCDVSMDMEVRKKILLTLEQTIRDGMDYLFALKSEACVYEDDLEVEKETYEDQAIAASYAREMHQAGWISVSEFDNYIVTCSDIERHYGYLERDQKHAEKLSAWAEYGLDLEPKMHGEEDDERTNAKQRVQVKKYFASLDHKDRRAMPNEDDEVPHDRDFVDRTVARRLQELPVATAARERALQSRASGISASSHNNWSCANVKSFDNVAWPMTFIRGVTNRYGHLDDHYIDENKDDWMPLNTKEREVLQARVDEHVVSSDEEAPLCTEKLTPYSTIVERRITHKQQRQREQQMRLLLDEYGFVTDFVKNAARRKAQEDAGEGQKALPEEVISSDGEQDGIYDWDSSRRSSSRCSTSEESQEDLSDREARYYPQVYSPVGSCEDTTSESDSDSSSDSSSDSDASQHSESLKRTVEQRDSPRSPAETYADVCSGRVTLQALASALDATGEPDPKDVELVAIALRGEHEFAQASSPRRIAAGRGQQDRLYRQRLEEENERLAAVNEVDTCVRQAWGLVQRVMDEQYERRVGLGQVAEGIVAFDVPVETDIHMQLAHATRVADQSCNVDIMNKLAESKARILTTLMQVQELNEEKKRKDIAFQDAAGVIDLMQQEEDEEANKENVPLALNYELPPPQELEEMEEQVEAYDPEEEEALMIERLRTTQVQEVTTTVGEPEEVEGMDECDCIVLPESSSESEAEDPDHLDIYYW